MTRAEVRKQFPALIAAWRALPENCNTDDRDLRFSDFYRWLKENHPAATIFRSRMGVSEDIEQWFDQETRQTWRN